MYYKEGLNSRFVCRNHNWGRKLSKFSGEISEGFIVVNKLFGGVGGVTFIFVMSKPCDSDVLVYVRFQSYDLNKAFFVILQAPLMLVFICYRYETVIGLLMTLQIRDSV